MSYSTALFALLTVLPSAFAAVTSGTTYAISPAQHAGMCIAPKSTKEGAKLVLKDCDEDDTTWLWTGSALQNTATNMCVDIPDEGKWSGNHAQVWGCYPWNTNQQYTIEGAMIHWDDFCLDLVDGKSTAGTEVQIWSCYSYNDNQQWSFTEVEEVDESCTESTTVSSTVVSTATASVSDVSAEESVTSTASIANSTESVSASEVYGNETAPLTQSASETASAGELYQTASATASYANETVSATQSYGNETATASYANETVSATQSYGNETASATQSFVNETASVTDSDASYATESASYSLNSTATLSSDLANATSTNSSLGGNLLAPGASESATSSSDDWWATTTSDAWASATASVSVGWSFNSSEPTASNSSSDAWASATASATNPWETASNSSSDAWGSATASSSNAWETASNSSSDAWESATSSATNPWETASSTASDPWNVTATASASDAWNSSSSTDSWGASATASATATTATSAISATASVGSMSSGKLQTSGTNIVDSDGNTVVLRGTNIGGYLVLEDWMCGITDDTGSSDRFSLSTLENRFGTDQARVLVEAWADTWLTDADFDELVEIGFNVIRLPFSFRTVQNADGSWRDDAFTRMDWVIANAKARGIYTIVDFHMWPGQEDSYSAISENTDDGASQRAAVAEIWRQVAEHYIDEPAIFGYDVINEPTGSYGDYLQQDLYTAVRSVDSDRIIIHESISTDPSTYGWTNVIYSMHEYNMMGSDFDSNREQWASGVQQYIDTWSGYGIPTLLGEFMADGDTLDYILNQANGQGLSWLSWAHSTVNMGRWGLWNHGSFNVNVGTDDYDTILAAWSSMPSTYHTSVYDQFKAGASGSTSVSSKRDAIPFAPRAQTTKRLHASHGGRSRRAGMGMAHAARGVVSV
ncbi:cellulase [Cryptococcus wingfieldii CBS 7118]|uniref:Cellulase n=1 Tax=Cryptococcus wingfieldii CBS 7118 TaxID=1295528 RepID=A0A1E3JEX6_9TREE|nr:cellulase [Cryptococcus wingfieldii CBS 7118]ODN99382.1 cellulase [Cryptococcus wingfieldii CBS 7118]